MEVNIIHLAIAALLGCVDAILCPQRYPRRKGYAHRCIRRRNYLKGHGYPWRSRLVVDSADETARKRAERLLGELVALGWVKSLQPKGDKSLAFLITDKGDQVARALCDYSLTEAYELALQIDRQAAADYVVAGRFVPETELAGAEWGSEGSEAKFADVQSRALPAIARGWISTRCSTQGHCWYVPGKLPQVPPVESDDLPEAEDDCIDAYVAAIKNERLHIDGMTDQPQELGDLALPVAMWTGKTAARLKVAAHA